MPNIKSAEKRTRTIGRKTESNIPFKSSMKSAIKKVEKSTDNEKENLLKVAIKKIDKAAAKGIIKKNTAARKKSRLTKKVNSK